MDTIVTFRPFETTTILSNDISSKFDFHDINIIANILNTRLNFKNYGSTIEKLSFVFIVVPPSNTIHEEKTGYFSKDKRLLLYRKLSYQKVSNASKKEVLPLMAEMYLKTIYELGYHEIPDFDYAQLGKDVEKNFIELGWIIDKLENNKQILQQLLKDLVTTMNRPSTNIQSELYIDPVKNTYLLMSFGWTTERFIHFVAFHFEIKQDGKIWLYQNRTNELIVEKLITLGINKEDIVLALVEPYGLEQASTT